MFGDLTLLGYGHILVLLLSSHVITLLSCAFGRLCFVIVTLLGYGHILVFLLSFNVLHFYSVHSVGCVS